MTERTVIFEFMQVGNSVKVTAMDPATLVEVSIIGPANAAQADLRAAALRKLNYVIKQKQKKAKDEGGLLV
jgi:hypothetical protein